MAEQERQDTCTDSKESYCHSLEHRPEEATAEPPSRWESYSLTTLSIFFDQC
jgi:hypothetical protein